MEELHLDYSTKNIPYPSLHSFKIDLTNRIIDFIRRLRWKALFFSKGKDDENETDVGHNTYGFKSQKNPPPDCNLKRFEDELFNIVKIIKLGNTMNPLQTTMKKDIAQIQQSNNEIFVKADKSRKIYKVPVQEYDRIVRNNITSCYRVDQVETENRINHDILETTSELKLHGRVNRIIKKQCYILFKDHKEGFNDKKPARLINPAKSELGRVSKDLIKNMVDQLTQKLKMNLWSSTKDSIEWFQRIPNKSKATFIQFDIVDFYPSINQKIFDDAVAFARNHINIPEKHLEIIQKCRRGILFHGDNAWIKKDADNNSNFDVPMGCYDSAQISDFIGVYILNTISRITDHDNIGLYRDDGLMVIPNSNGPETNRIHKKLSRVFRYLGFKIEIKSNLKVVNYLDVTFDLRNESFRPYSKDNSDPVYVHVQSNHPNHIIRQIPKSVNSRISRNSSSKRIFDNCKTPYNRALTKSGYVGYDQQLTYLRNNTNKSTPRRKNRPRKVLWFNPPYCRTASINIAREFLKLIDICFPNDHPFRKICNRYNLKVSYSCCRNMENIISTHNTKTLTKYFENNVETNQMSNARRECNCRNSNRCPLGRRCLTENVVYQAKIYPNGDTSKYKLYVGISKGQWKMRYYVHRHSFKYRSSRNKTALSKHYWLLKDRGKEPVITWKILTTAKTPRSLNEKCILCLEEKIRILTSDRRRILNKRTELLAKCRHLAELLPKLDHQNLGQI